MANIATSAPEVLIAHIAATTTRMRIGAGGIMLPNHNPLRVVEIFRTLEALHPGRIDLGLGRAPGTDPVTASALRRGPADDPNDRLAELLAFANATFPEGHPSGAWSRCLPTSRCPRSGCSVRRWRARRLPRRSACATRSRGTSRCATRRRDRVVSGQFRPSAGLDSAVCHARRHGRLRRRRRTGGADGGADPAGGGENRTGRRAPIASVEEALAYRFTPEEEAIADEFLRGAIIGGPHESSTD